MKFFIFMAGAIAISLIWDVIDEIRNQPKTYKELMKDPAFAADARLQEKLTRRVDMDDNDNREVL